MKTPKRWIGVAALLLAAAACEIFEDRTPRQIFFRMEGPPGAVVSVVYSKQFVATVDELGITRLRVFGSDTVMHALPIDTVIDVRLEQRLYIEAVPSALADTLSVDARVDVDDRVLYDGTGKLYPTDPWQFLYTFNQRTTSELEVII